MDVFCRHKRRYVTKPTPEILSQVKASEAAQNKRNLEGKMGSLALETGETSADFNFNSPCFLPQAQNRIRCCILLVSSLAMKDLIFKRKTGKFGHRWGCLDYTGSGGCTVSNRCYRLCGTLCFQRRAEPPEWLTNNNLH